MSKLFPDIRERLEKWHEELPKLIQPEKSHIQNITDIARLLKAVDLATKAMTRVKDWKDVCYGNSKNVCGCDVCEALIQLKALSEGK